MKSNFHPIKQIKKRIRLRKIEKAIGIRLYKWQRKAILKQSGEADIIMNRGRATGKTVAACVWMLMYRKEPLNIHDTIIEENRRTYRERWYPVLPYHGKEFPVPDPDAGISELSARHTLRVLRELHEKCKEKGIEVFDLCLH